MKFVSIRNYFQLKFHQKSAFLSLTEIKTLNQYCNETKLPNAASPN